MNFGILGPTYDPASVQPMRDELTVVGFDELLTSDDVQKAFEVPDKTVLLLINSVCGCAAGNARPGAAMALQHTKIPDVLTTAFAGMEKDAVAKARAYLAPHPPSSPCIALLKDAKIVKILERRHIENRTAEMVARELVEWFEEYCERPGPSISPEDFARLTPYKACGSTIPLARPD